MAVVLDLNNPLYCELKAVEQIKEAQSIMDFIKENEGMGRMLPVNYNEKRKQYHEKIAQAISLLALARLQRGCDKNQDKGQTGSKDTSRIDGLLENP